MPKQTIPIATKINIFTHESDMQIEIEEQQSWQPQHL